MYWDHCHEHGFIRGPVCASCNTYEGGGYQFTNRPGALQHLLQCDGCRREGVVPPRHQPEVVLGTFVLDPHGSCTHPPRYPWGAVEGNRSIRFRLQCWHHTSPYQWEQVVPASQVRLLVSEFVEKALAAETDTPDQDSA